MERCLEEGCAKGQRKCLSERCAFKTGGKWKSDGGHSGVEKTEASDEN